MMMQLRPVVGLAALVLVLVATVAAAPVKEALIEVKSAAVGNLQLRPVEIDIPWAVDSKGEFTITVSNTGDTDIKAYVWDFNEDQYIETDLSTIDAGEQETSSGIPPNPAAGVGEVKLAHWCAPQVSTPPFDLPTGLLCFNDNCVVLTCCEAPGETTPPVVGTACEGETCDGSDDQWECCPDLREFECLVLQPEEDLLAKYALPGGLAAAGLVSIGGAVMYAKRRNKKPRANNQKVGFGGDELLGNDPAEPDAVLTTTGIATQDTIEADKRKEARRVKKERAAGDRTSMGSKGSAGSRGSKGKMRSGSAASGSGRSAASKASKGSKASSGSKASKASRGNKASSNGSRAGRGTRSKSASSTGSRAKAGKASGGSRGGRSGSRSAK